MLVEWFDALYSPHMGLMSNAVLISEKHFGAICIDHRVLCVEFMFQGFEIQQNHGKDDVYMVVMYVEVLKALVLTSRIDQ